MFNMTQVSKSFQNYDHKAQTLKHIHSPFILEDINDIYKLQWLS